MQRKRSRWRSLITRNQALWPASRDHMGAVVAGPDGHVVSLS